MNIRIISMFVLLLALIFSGCAEEKPQQTPVETPAPTTKITTAPPTVVQTTEKPAPTLTPPKKKGLIISDVDEYGFNKLTLVNVTGIYENHTITINRSDTVKWVSVTDAGYYLTIVSKEGLWNNSSSFLKYSFRSFSYTFNESGTYEVYLKEFPRLPHQKIIVRP